MRILVIGATGLVGSHVMASANAARHKAFGVSRSSTGERALDLGDTGSLERTIGTIAPDAVVCAAGWTWVDGCERDPGLSKERNHDQPARLAALCARHRIRLLHYSTSYVFDGLEGDYRESDTPRPINVYGRHKADAEKAVLDATGGSAIIARLICVWGREAAGKNFAYQVARAYLSREALRLPSDQLGNPTWAGDVADWSVRLLGAGERGTWHLAGPDPGTSRPEWAALVAKGLAARGAVGQLKVEAVTTADLGQDAPRPLRAGLRTDKVQAAYPLPCRKPSEVEDVLATLPRP